MLTRGDTLVRNQNYTILKNHTVERVSHGLSLPPWVFPYPKNINRTFLSSEIHSGVIRIGYHNLIHIYIFLTLRQRVRRLFGQYGNMQYGNYTRTMLNCIKWLHVGSPNMYVHPNWCWECQNGLEFCEFYIPTPLISDQKCPNWCWECQNGLEFCEFCTPTPLVFEERWLNFTFTHQPLWLSNKKGTFWQCFFFCGSMRIQIVFRAADSRIQAIK